MKEINVYEVLRRPLVTEKGSVLQTAGKYIFEVAPGANKHQIKQSVETAFKVSVTAVNIVKMPGKTRRSGSKTITTSPWKKAIVSLKTGDKIELFEGV